MTICLNPILERIHTIDRLCLGNKNFSDSVAEVPSGFGITAARVITRLGEKVVVCALVGQVLGQVIHRRLQEEGIVVHCVEIQAASRLVSTVFERVTRRSSMVAIDPSPQVSIHELTLFEQTLGKYVAESDLVLIGGSLPDGVPTNTCGKLIRKFKANGKKVILDTRGPALSEAIADVPYMVKLDLEQAKVYIAKKRPNRKEICTLASRLHSNGIEIVAITLGKAGAIVACSEGIMLAVPPTIETVNSYGSGDAFVAGFAVGLVKGKSKGDSIRLATACGTANAMTLLPGHINRGDIESLCSKVEVRGLADWSRQ